MTEYNLIEIPVMKKILLFFQVMTVTLLFCSCSKDDNDVPGPKDPEMADYTVIFWGMAGTNDYSVCMDMCQLAYNYERKRINDNVRIMGLLKTSLELADTTFSQFDQTFLFESDTIRGKSITSKMISFADRTTQDLADDYTAAFKALNGKVYADVNYPLNDVDSLAAFIRKAAEKYPAHNYVLMLFGHGGGFSPVKDVPTRSCVFDDYNSNKSLPADAVVSAVRKSGVKIQTLFTQCCLMATLENMAAYSQCFDYGVLSAETTLGYYFPDYLVLLSQAGDDEQQMQAKTRELIDDYADNVISMFDDVYTSHGFYDLKKTPRLLSAVKDASAWYSENYTKYQDAIETALSEVVICINLEETDSVPVREGRSFMQQLLHGQIDPEEAQGLSAEELVNMMVSLVQMSPTYGFPFAHLLNVTLDQQTFAGYENAVEQLKSIYNNYMTALKDMAYIRATAKPKDAVKDYEYLYTSPTVNIFSLNQNYYYPLLNGKQQDISDLIEAMYAGDTEKGLPLMERLFGGTIFANIAPYETANGNYCSSVFDNQVKWSNFLKQLEVNPSFLFNPDRMQISLGY